MEIGKVIRYYRERKGYSQKELAEKVHMSVRTIGHYETGTRSPSIEVLQRLAEVLYLRPADFLLPVSRKQEKYVFYDNVWIYDYDEEREEHILKDDTHIEDYQNEEIFITVIGNDIIYFPIKMVFKAISEEGAKKKTYCTFCDEIIPIVELMQTTEENFVCIKIGREKKEIAVAVDSFISVESGVQTCEAINAKTRMEKEKEEEWCRIRRDASHISINSARMESEELYVFSKHLSEYAWILEKDCSSTIKRTKIEELLHALETMSKEAFDKNRESNAYMLDFAIEHNFAVKEQYSELEDIQYILLQHLERLEK